MNKYTVTVIHSGTTYSETFTAKAPALALYKDLTAAKVTASLTEVKKA